MKETILNVLERTQELIDLAKAKLDNWQIDSNYLMIVVMFGMFMYSYMTVGILPWYFIEYWICVGIVLAMVIAMFTFIRHDAETKLYI